MVASDEFGSYLCDELSPLGAVSLRRMFGKTGVFCNGVMFAMVNDNELFRRVDNQNREAFAEAASVPSLNYSKGGQTIDLSFWQAPARLFDDHDELIAWARLALDAAHRVASKRKHIKPTTL
jgi:DNA transformation protein and related proteins